MILQTFTSWELRAPRPAVPFRLFEKAAKCRCYFAYHTMWKFKIFLRAIVRLCELSIIFTFLLFNLYVSACLSFLGAPRSQTRGSLFAWSKRDEKITSLQFACVSVRQLPLFLSRYVEQLPVAESHFMFGRQSAAATSRLKPCGSWCFLYTRFYDCANLM